MLRMGALENLSHSRGRANPKDGWGTDNGRHAARANTEESLHAQHAQQVACILGGHCVQLPQ